MHHTYYVVLLNDRIITNKYFVNAYIRCYDGRRLGYSVCKQTVFMRMKVEYLDIVPHYLVYVLCIPH